MTARVRPSITRRVHSLCRGALVLRYHDIVDDDAAPRSRWDVHVSDLRRQLRVLVRLGFAFVSADELVRRRRSGETLDGLAVVTFDDALEGVYGLALSCLAEFDAAATVFTVASDLGGRPQWWPEMGRTMTVEELTQLVEAGHRLGSGTMTGRSLLGLGAGELQTELRGSKDRLEELSNQPVELLAYPSGHHDARVRDAAESAGYQAGFSRLMGRVCADDDPFRVPRLTMGQHMTLARFLSYVGRPASSWPDHQLDRVSGDPLA